MPASLLPGGGGEPQGVCRLRMRLLPSRAFRRIRGLPHLNELSNFQGFGARKFPWDRRWPSLRRLPDFLSREGMVSLSCRDNARRKPELPEANFECFDVVKFSLSPGRAVYVDSSSQIVQTGLRGGVCHPGGDRDHFLCDV